MKSKTDFQTKLFFISIAFMAISQVSLSQTTIINYNFNNGNSYATLAPVLTYSITCSISGTEAFHTMGGTPTFSQAFTPNTSGGNGIAMQNSSGQNTRYWTFQFGGASLNQYKSFRFYIQALSQNTGAKTITLAYSTDGINFINYANTMTQINSSYSEKVFDLSAISALNNQSSIYIRFMASGASGNGSLIIDNFEVLAELSGTTGGGQYWDKTGNNIYLHDTSNNVGIGLTNPSEKLTVQGNALINGNAAINGDLSISGKISLNNTEFNGNLDVAGKINADSMHIINQLKIGTHSMYINGSPFLSGSDEIKSTGGQIAFGGTDAIGSTFTSSINVGIGIQSPAYKLDVADNININPFFANMGYRINGDLVLQNWGTDNIFVGAGAGVSNYLGLGKQNTFMGKLAGFSNTTGGLNTFIGNRAGFSNTEAWQNTAIGSSALFANILGAQNTAIGSASLAGNTYGYENTAIGYNALTFNTTGNYNTAIGSDALIWCDSGSFNTANGHFALANNVLGNGNTANGAYALSVSTSGDKNTANGYSALVYNSGDNNTANGADALSFNSGSGNTADGAHALYGNSSGNNITALGYNANVADTNLHNTTVIGANAVAQNSNEIRLGNDSIKYLYCKGAWNASTPDYSPNLFVAGDGRIMRSTAPPISVVNAQNGCSKNNNKIVLGNIVGDTLAKLINDREIPMNNKNLVFTLGDTATVKNRIGIGTNAPVRRLEVFDKGAPQLRLTNSIDSGIMGRFTDFKTTSAGNLRINPSDTLSQSLDGRVGINLAAGLEPKNTLEINTSATYVAYQPGFSGLRFTDLKAWSSPVPNKGYGGVLALDTNGDVIYVKGVGTGLGIGICSQPTTFSSGVNGAIDLQHKNNFYFTGQAGDSTSALSSVGIGYDCDSLLLAKLNVKQEKWFKLSHIATNKNYSLASLFSNETTGGGEMSGGIFSSNTSDAITDYGIWSVTSGGSNVNWGAIGEAYGASNFNIGVVGNAHSPLGSSTQNIGVWGYVSGTSFSISPIPFPTSDLAGLFLGDVWISGTTSLTGFDIVSDSRLKKDTVPFLQGIDVIRNMHPITFKYNGLAGFESKKTHQGLIAEQLESLAPYAIDTLFARLYTTDSLPTTLLSIKGESILYTAINAIKELDAEVTTLQQTLPPGPVFLISPANFSPDVPLNATFTWHKAARADYYSIFIYTNGMLPYYYQLILTDTLVNVNLPYADNDYSWGVVGHNNVGSDAPVLQTWQFHTKMPDAPDAPTLVSPTNGATDLPMANVFTWNASERAENYTLFISTSESIDDAVTIIQSKDTFAIAGVPLCNTKYYWFVRAGNIKGNSELSEKWNFTAYEPSIAAPTLIEPLDGATITAGTPINWEKAVGNIYYNIYISTSTDEADVVYSNSLPSVMNMVVPQLRGEGQYYWWVTACNGCGVCSDKSEIRSFYYVEPLKTSDPILSDSNFKTNISPITDALSKVLQLNGKYFNWNLANHPELKDTTRQMGLIAQEVLPVVPEVIKVNRLGQYSLDYERLVSLFIEATKEQQTQITTMANEIDALKTSVHNCCDSNSVKHMMPQTQHTETISIINAELTNKAAILYQNMPNPFGDGTTIRYFIPDDVNSAAIVFHNEYGQELKTVDITEKGMGQINLTTTNLSDGIYTYSLLIDGKLIETKRMMKIK